MESLHDLLNTSSRVVNRHAQRIYGFIPAIVIHDKDKDDKQKRHLRGMVQVYFPGLQDLGPELIAPWARLVAPSGGNMIDVNRKKTVTITIQVPGPPQPKQVTTEERVPKSHQETRTRKVKKKKEVKVDWEVFALDSGQFLSGQAVILNPGTQKLATVAQQFVTAKGQHPGVKIIIHGHTSPSGPHQYNLGLAMQRVNAAKQVLLQNGVTADDIDSSTPSGAPAFAYDHSGERFNAKTGEWEPNPGDSPTHAQAPFRNSNMDCETGCRRVDVMFDYHGCSSSTEEEEVDEQYQVTVQDPPEIVTHTTTIMVPGPPQDRQIQIEVPDPGPGPFGGGLFVPPQKGDEVLCGFEHGDIHRPYVIGALWNGKDKIPEPVTNSKTEDNRPKGCPETKSMKGDSLSGDGGKNQIQHLRSRTGNVLAMDDKNGSVRTSDRSGTSCMQQDKNKIEIMQSSKDIGIFAQKKVRFDCTDFIVKTTKNVWLDATKNIKSHSGKDHNLCATDGKLQVSCTAAMQITSQADIGWDAQQAMAVGAKGGALNLITPQKVNLGGQTKAEIQAQGGAVNIIAAQVKADGANGIGISSDGNIDIAATIRIKFKGSNVLMNSGGSPPGQMSLGDLLMGALRAVVGTVVEGAVAVGQAIASSPIAAAVVGAAVGFCVLGPVGAVAGAAIGYNAAGGNAPPASNPPAQANGQAGGGTNVGGASQSNSCQNTGQMPAQQSNAPAPNQSQAGGGGTNMSNAPAQSTSNDPSQNSGQLPQQSNAPAPANSSQTSTPANANTSNADGTQSYNPPPSSSQASQSTPAPADSSQTSTPANANTSNADGTQSYNPPPSSSQANQSTPPAPADSSQTSTPANANTSNADGTESHVPAPSSSQANQSASQGPKTVTNADGSTQVTQPDGSTRRDTENADGSGGTSEYTARDGTRSVVVSERPDPGEDISGGNQSAGGSSQHAPSQTSSTVLAGDDSPPQQVTSRQNPNASSSPEATDAYGNAPPSDTAMA